ncbi:MAG: hypothetical protein JWN84_952 [Nocardioides sp.]|jgi:AmiR/NasT family two-component response regulator|nr:hypothetical protein [Nocardioides sp.]
MRNSAKPSRRGATGRTVSLVAVKQVDSKDALIADQLAEIRTLRAALETASRLGQGIGVLRERYGIDENKAFAMLTSTAVARQEELKSVIAHLLTTGDLPEAVPPA